MKIVYIMNVDWGWIKQRPHFIAEKLALNNEIILFHPYTYRNKKRNLCSNKSKIISPHKYFNIPFFGKNKILEKINSIYLKIYFGIIIHFLKPDLVWIAGYPYASVFLSNRILSKSIYDCMDDYYAMTKNMIILKYERELVNKCKHIIVSSKSLKDILINRYSIDSNKVTLVRNGYDGDIIKTTQPINNNKEVFNLAYIGTISSWFDFNLIKRISELSEEISIHIVGPIELSVVEKCKFLECDNIIFYGAMEHQRLYSFAKNMDCLIMPFIVNDIIRAVDPVKLYEYINFNKNILTIYYPEIERFRNFVNFYNSENEAIKQLKKIMNNSSVSYTNQQRIAFLKLNNWQNRMKTIVDVLNNSYPLD